MDGSKTAVIGRVWMSRRRGQPCNSLSSTSEPGRRLATINLVRDIRSIGRFRRHDNLLGDSDPGVSRAAAASVWERQKNENCTSAVKALRDEIRGSTSMGTSDGLSYGKHKGIRALDLLIDSAPDERARAAISDLANREVVIEERINRLIQLRSSLPKRSSVSS